MKSNSTCKLGAIVVVLSLLCPTIALGGGLSVVVYDNFDDGNFDGWLSTPYWGWAGTLPNVVSSPEGYALQGVGSGYSQDPGLEVYISHPVTLSNVGALRIEMRARSGSQWPNASEILLTRGNDAYLFADYGEGNQMAQFVANINGTWGPDCRYPINATPWHDFAWARDAIGWWSLSIDGQELWHNFVQENRLTSFDGIGLHPLRNQSEIEWVRVTAEVVPVPGAVLLGAIGLGFANYMLKRRSVS